MRPEGEIYEKHPLASYKVNGDRLTIWSYKCNEFEKQINYYYEKIKEALSLFFY